ncbi:hypothetical protein PR202_ga26815 [Eleusine coracana subsp. coracana]|uniref:Uncharacterized protein n=1 Tax=Eleusine coracana subsp. coracana TaxID=191504 RepID=A0AAV5DEJ6_ELECO|nr:hypothetical protein QOZ80_3AG0236400 [Eleusine coracana subsp. coracana]GJN08855.1 hypothetical protein PR202_ga26815 [Eleusine coracana subsp. coracana]
MEITMLQPIYPTPHPLAGEMVPLTVFDRAAFDLFVPTVRAYTAPAPSNELVKESLARALVLYPHMAGRLVVDDQGRRFIHVNNRGALVIEVTVSADLADVLVDGTISNVGEVYPPVPEENVGAPLLHVKLNRYRCGGLVVGVIHHHHVADGQGISSFVSTWARAAREGKDFIVPAPPIHDRASTAIPRGTPTPVFDHQNIEFKGVNEDGISSKSHAVVPMEKIRNFKVHFTPEFIAELKSCVGFRCSTFQCLFAHVWKKVTAARGLHPEEFTKVRVAVNCRDRANPPVSADFFGNMVLWAFPRLQVRELLNSTYGRVVDVIRDAVSRIDGEYIQSLVDYGALADMKGEKLEATAPVAGTMLCPDMEIDSWVGFRFHDMDLGTGPPCAFLPPDMPVEGLMVIVPSGNDKGGADLFIALAEDHVDAFQQICLSLDCREDGARFISARM